MKQEWVGRAHSLHHTLSIKLSSMSIINVIIVLVVVGLILWLINRYIPMQSTIKSILNVVVIICVILWLLRAFGIWGGGDIDL
jgi:Flp pilus assembly protein protease CpaA